jgi:uncharacterized integral membrane protein
MRKTLFLWLTITLFFLTLIIAFENITGATSFLLLFYTVSQMSLFLIVLLSAFLGFLICFFLMLFSYEKRLEKEEQEHEETVGSSPGALVEKTDARDQTPEASTAKKEKTLDEFDEDEEVLG